MDILVAWLYVVNSSPQRHTVPDYYVIFLVIIKSEMYKIKYEKKSKYKCFCSILHQQSH